MRTTAMKYSGDFVHTCNSKDPTIDNEDIPILGNWEDFTGSDTNVHGPNMQRGASNNLWGTDAQVVAGASNSNRTRRGNLKELVRTRQAFGYIEDVKDLVK
jgi:hypothetical protein|tara:strand:+ start:1984 stop:2286 length:303 start_codon:yes stop_codon:yes gene_type:complete